MSVPLWIWVAFLAAVAVLLVIDLLVGHRKPHAVETREAAIWTGVWIGLGLAFGVGVWMFAGSGRALEYYTGYLLEKGLSVDNLFVFLVIFGAFAVPKPLQHRVLFWGILGAVLMRGLFIWAGVALIDRFEWVLYIFGAFLVVSGVRLMFKGEVVEHPEQSRPIRWMRRIVPATEGYRGSRFFVRENGRLLATPLLFVLVTVELTDVIFATDSIPAIFGVTRDPFIIFSSNVLAILGLRAMFFLLADIMERFHYLQAGLAVVLVFIGAKMLAEEFVHVPVPVSLAVVCGVLIASIAASMIRTRHEVRPGPD
jgi:tellurite resistance protein TerC